MYHPRPILYRVTPYKNEPFALFLYVENPSKVKVMVGGIYNEIRLQYEGCHSLLWQLWHWRKKCKVSKTLRVGLSYILLGHYVSFIEWHLRTTKAGVVLCDPQYSCSFIQCSFWFSKINWVSHESLPMSYMLLPVRVAGKSHAGWSRPALHTAPTNPLQRRKLSGCELAGSGGKVCWWNLF